MGKNGAEREYKKAEEVADRIRAQGRTSQRCGKHCQEGRGVEGDVDSRALGCAGRASTGGQASARPAPADAAGAGPVDVADLPMV